MTITIKTIDGRDVTINSQDVAFFSICLAGGIECSKLEMKNGDKVIYDPTDNAEAAKKISEMLSSAMPDLFAG